jgi:hypothetical protein
VAAKFLSTRTRTRTPHFLFTSVSLTLLAACSLLAPTEAELSGGRDREAPGASGGGEDMAGAGQDGGAPAGGSVSGGAGGELGGAAPSGTGGSTAGMGGGNGGVGGAAGGSSSTNCVADVASQVPKASSLRDDFADGTPSPNFRVDGDTEICALEASGEVVVDLPQPLNSSYFCFYETQNDYDLTCDSVVLKVPEVAGPVVGVQTYLYVGPDPEHLVMVVVENGTYLFSTDAVRFADAGRYDPASPWWRLRETSIDGQRKVVFETSSDAATWTQRYSTARPYPLNEVKVAFGAGAYRPSSATGAGVFACYNAPAGCE